MDSSSLPPPPPLPPTPNISQQNLENLNPEIEVGLRRHQDDENQHDDNDDVELPAEMDDEKWCEDAEPQYEAPTTSRYQPSEMLSSILKSRGITPSSSTSQMNRSPARNSDYDVREKNGYDSPKPHLYNRDSDSPIYKSPTYKSPIYRSPTRISPTYRSPTRRSPTYGSPSRNFYDSPRGEYDSPSLEYNTVTNDGISPFAKLSESLKILQQHQAQPSDDIQTPVPPTPVDPKPPVVLEPSADLKPVIERLANYVAKNGNEFEEGIREKRDPRFDFLNNWNMYHGFYLEMKKKAFVDVENEKEKGWIRGNILFCSSRSLIFISI